MAHMTRSRCLLPARRFQMFTLALVLVLALAWVHGSDAESVKSRVKMQRSNPVLPALIDGESVNLVVTTGLLCAHAAANKIAPHQPSTAAKIDFDYARRLLRFQLQGVIQEFAVLALQVPALQYTGKMPIGHFHLKKQWLSPASIEYFLQSSNASGFIGVGLAFRPMYSRFWTMFDDDDDDVDSATQQYSYRGMLSSNATSKLAALAIRSSENYSASDAGADSDSEDEEGEEEDLVNGYIDRTLKGAAKLVWSEPLAPVNDRDDPANSQGISFPIHRAFFRCAPSITDQDESSSPPPSSSSSYPFNPQRAHDVEIFGEFSGNWDVALDFNVPCLALPQQFFDSLAGWIGLRYNDELKLAEISSASMPLPNLVFSLSLDGPQLTIPLQRLVLPELQIATSPADSGSNSTTDVTTTTQRVCIQRSGSIIQNGAAVFSPLDQDAGSVQRYRLHGSLTLPLFNMFQAPIVFGAMVLDNFEQIVIDGTTKQTGIQDSAGGSSSASSAPTYAMCMRPAQCIGQQQYLHRLNACQDPDCSLYYFQSLDVTTKQCVIDAGWTWTIAITVGVFVAVETLFSISMRQLVFKTRTSSSSSSF